MPPTLEGQVVRLRAPTEDDLAFCLAVANDPDLRGWLAFERPMTEAQERAWLAGLDDDRQRVWIIETKPVEANRADAEGPGAPSSGREGARGGPGASAGTRGGRDVRPDTGERDGEGGHKGGGTRGSPGERLGLVSLDHWAQVPRHAELGITLAAREDRGQGFGTEAIRLALLHGFGDMNLQRVYLHVHEDNPARRLYARLGFREEGRLRRHVFKRGAFRDLVVMGVLREEWRP